MQLRFALSRGLEVAGVLSADDADAGFPVECFNRGGFYLSCHHSSGFSLATLQMLDAVRGGPRLSRQNRVG